MISDTLIFKTSALKIRAMFRIFTIFVPKKPFAAMAGLHDV